MRARRSLRASAVRRPRALLWALLSTGLPKETLICQHKNEEKERNEEWAETIWGNACEISIRK